MNMCASKAEFTAKIHNNHTSRFLWKH